MPVRLKKDYEEELALNPLRRKEIELDENIQREDLAWEDRCELTRQIDELKREIHGEKLPGSRDEEGWDQSKTAEHLGKSQPQVSLEIRIARALKERPEFRELVKRLPMTVAMKKIEQVKEAEKLGEMKVDLTKESKLLFGDSLEEIKKVKTGSVGLVIIDPPFGIENLEEYRSEQQDSTCSYAGLVGDSDNLSKHDADSLIANMAPELFRVLKPGCHLYCFFTFTSYQSFVDSFSLAGFNVDAQPLIWNKGKPQSPFSGLKYSPCYEPVLFMVKPGETKRRLAKACKKDLPFPPLHAAKKIHPFEKPQALLKFFISQSSFKNEVVLDCFAGSGSTLRAASRLNRVYWGCEKDKQNYAIAQVRLLEGAKKDEAKKPSGPRQEPSLG